MSNTVGGRSTRLKAASSGGAASISSCMSGQVLLLGIYQQVLPGLVLLLLHQLPLPGTPPPLPRQHQPLLSQPLPLRARCNRPQPRQPISGQNPLLVHGSTLSRPSVRYKKPTWKPTSPHFRTFQDGAHIPAYRYF